MADEEKVVETAPETPAAPEAVETRPGGEQPDVKAEAPETPAPDPAAEQPGVSRLRRERDRFRTELEQTREELAQLRKGGAKPPEVSAEEAEARRQAAWQDPDKYFERLYSERRSEERRLESLEKAESLVVAAASKAKASGVSQDEFEERMANILDEWFPGDRQHKLYPAHFKMERALKEYDRTYGTKSTPDKIVRTPPGGGKGAPADAKPKTGTPTDEEWADVRSKLTSGHDAEGLSEGHRILAQWKKDGRI